MSSTLAELESSYAAIQKEIDKVKDFYIVTSQNTCNMEEEVLKEKQELSRSSEMIKLSTEEAGKDERQLSEVEQALSEMEKVYNEANSYELDESFGHHYKEIEVLMKECDWDFNAFQRMLKDRSAFVGRIQRLQNDRTGKERAKQFTVVSDNYDVLNKENQTLHALQLRLKNELIAAERDVEKACGVRRFDPSTAFNVNTK